MTEMALNHNNPIRRRKNSSLFKKITKKNPPKIAVSILKHLLDPNVRYSAMGDFEERFQAIAHQHSLFRGNVFYWIQIFLVFPAFAKNLLYWSLDMLKNYIKIALRIIQRHKGYSFIKISGLSIGMACCILILLFVRFELSFDSFHTNKDRIYRVLSELDLAHGTDIVPITAIPLAPAIKNDLQDVAKVSRITGEYQRLFSVGDKKFFEDLSYADADFFNIFTFPLITGDPKTALAEPFTMVISETIADKYFGKTDPVGKTVLVQNSQDYKITGVMEDVPENSHLRFDILASFSSRNNEERVKGNYWDRFSNDYTYILLSEGADPQELESKFPAFMAKHIPVEEDRYNLHLQSLRDIHFSRSNYDIARRTNKDYLYAYSAIAFFILIIACINFMNLATARSSGRAKEVGIRKVVGARRAQLIKQFFTESVLLAILSLVGSVCLVLIFLPKFNQFIRRDLTLDVFNDMGLLTGLLAISLFVGFVSGSYPALILSAFKPARVLKKTFDKKVKGLSFRAVTSVLQFSISIILIFATAVVYAQIHYMKTKDLGFDAEQILSIPLSSPSLREKTEIFKSEILRNPSVLSACASFGTPASGTGSGRSFIPEGYPEGESIHMETLFIDFDFIETYGLTLTSGRNFSREFSTDAEHAFILNETAAKKLGWDDPVGKQFSEEDSGVEAKVIGVIKDFHYESTLYKIAPMVLTLRPYEFSHISAKIRLEEVSQVLAFLEAKWREFAPEYPFACIFVDEEFDMYYNFERRQGQLFTYCSILAIFISCMGIFGLASFTAEKRIKEIGIRKVLGASVSGIVLLLSREFVKWVLVANIIGWPVAYFVMNRWLQGFAYRVNIGAWMFVFSAFLVLIIAMLTVSYQSIKTALSDPINSLRYE
jgi:putative ABC transport system permease protein